MEGTAVDRSSSSSEGSSDDFLQDLVPSLGDRATHQRTEQRNNQQDGQKTGFSSVFELPNLQKELTELLATPKDREFFRDFDKLSKSTGAPELTDSQKASIVGLRDDQKEMFALTLKRLHELADGKINPVQYMCNVMRDAAQLSEKHGRAPDSWNYLKSERSDLFIDYVGMVMSQESHGVMSDLVRLPASGGTDHTGCALEVLSRRIMGKHANDGFNPNIVDDQDKSSTVTHHFREFLKLGYLHGWQGIGNYAARVNDDPAKNPGDVRNAYFANMIGVGLSWGTITPKEAAEMTEWAFTANQKTPPPWGEKATKGTWLDTAQYDIDDWLRAFRARKAKNGS
jgi:hypothetical protein